MKNLLSVVTFCLISLPCLAQSDSQPMMLMGSFHFANPGLDVVKTEVMDVMADHNQLYLAQLSQNISQFNPTVVMLEFNPDNTETLNKEYQQYLTGQFELPVNEIYQIGFRVAKQAGVKQLMSLDETTIGWNAQPLFEYLATKDQKTDALVKQKIAALTDQSNADQQNLNLEQLMRKTNDPQMEKENKSFYLLTNAVGANDGFSGADAAASWWHRNFRIYAKIQQQALAGHRVFALAGQGHVAILRDLIALDAQFIEEDVMPYLKTK